MRRTLILSFVLASCGGASRSEDGLGAMLRVEGAQFIDAAMPGAIDGPRVTSVDNPRTRVVPGETMKILRGTLEPAANAVAIGISGDSVHWISTAQAPNNDTPELLSFDVRLIFSRALPPGPLELTVRAVDRQGRYGPPIPVMLEATALVEVEGELVVALTWDTNADLDLHLVDPRGTDIWARNPVENGALLVLDSNAACVIDGRRTEAVRYETIPPAGNYLVRVDAFSLCGEAAARWSVEVILRGETIARARGTSTAAHTRGEHQAGSGITAAAFEVR